jgi:8-oxo-dGTP pyrophosphatase MutT (NUDIX family)
MPPLTPLGRLFAALANHAPRRVDEPERSRAAVALLLTPDPDRLLLIRRAERPGDPWSGHLALPGGRFQPSDVDLLTTAVRETLEETGVAVEPGWLRAELDDLAPLTVTLPRIMVRPFVFGLPEAVPASASNEVVAATWLELETLARPGVFGRHTVSVGGSPREVPGYHLPDGVLWGMTERIVTPVLRRWMQERRAR